MICSERKSELSYQLFRKTLVERRRVRETEFITSGDLAANKNRSITVFGFSKDKNEMKHAEQKEIGWGGGAGGEFFVLIT